MNANTYGRHGSACLDEMDWECIDNESSLAEMVEHPDYTLMRIRDHIHPDDRASHHCISACLQLVLKGKYR